MCVAVTVHAKSSPMGDDPAPGSRPPTSWTWEFGKCVNDMLFERCPLFQCMGNSNMRSCQFSVVCSHELLQQIHSKCGPCCRWKSEQTAMVKQHRKLKNTPGVNGPLSLPDASKQCVCDCTCLRGSKRGAGCAVLAIGIKPYRCNTMPCARRSLLFEVTPPWPLLPRHLSYPCLQHFSCFGKKDTCRSMQPRNIVEAACAV